MCLDVIFFILMLLQFAKFLDLMGWCLMSFGKFSVVTSVSSLPIPPPSHFSIFLILVGLYWKMLDPFHCVREIAHNFSVFSVHFPSLSFPLDIFWPVFHFTNPVFCFANLLLNYNIEFLISVIFFSSKTIFWFFFLQIEVLCWNLFMYFIHLFKKTYFIIINIITLRSFSAKSSI